MDDIGVSSQANDGESHDDQDPDDEDFLKFAMIRLAGAIREVSAIVVQGHCVSFYVAHLPHPVTGLTAFLTSVNVQAEVLT